MEGCHKVLPQQQESNPTRSKLRFKSTPKTIQALLFYFGQLYFLSSVSGPYAPARKHASHLAVFIFIVIQQLQSMPGYLYHLPHKRHFSKRMVDTWGPGVQKSF